MIVTDIVELDKKRNKIFIDGEFAFVLYKGELREYGIKANAELSQSSYEEIVGTLLSKRAKLRAMNLLQKKDYTEKQLRDKLKEGLYPQELVDEAIAYVKSYKYLDDERFALDLLREKKLLITHGGGFHWEQPDHFRIVYLPEVEVLKKAVKGMEEFFSTYHQ